MAFLKYLLATGFVTLGLICCANAQSVSPLVQQFNLPSGKITPSGSLGQFATSGRGGLNVVSPNGTPAHFYPTPSRAKALRAMKPAGVAGAIGAAGPLGTPPLTYHTGGRIMSPYVLVYPIYWFPPTLQNGAAATYSSKYTTVTYLLAAWLTQGHGLNAVASQYYEIVNNVTNYIPNWGSLGEYYVDTSPYPASACNGAYSVPGVVTAGNCITDAQITAEIQRVMAIKGWTGGYNKIFMLFTARGEGSCFNSTTTSDCSYTAYCGYHSYMTTPTNPTMYTNQPYATQGYCTSGTTPNGDIEADSAASVASHEIEETVTDPLLNAWYDSSGYENGDECAWIYGTNPITNPANGVAANQFMNGWYFELQQEWSQNSGPTGACVDGSQ